MLSLLSVMAFGPCGCHGGTQRNVLYLVFDDLRPELSFYGRAVHSPHLQKLADSGTVFERAYTQIAVCAPSRMSFTTGRRPNSTQAINFINHFRQAVPPPPSPPPVLPTAACTACPSLPAFWCNAHHPATLVRHPSTLYTAYPTYPSPARTPQTASGPSAHPWLVAGPAGMATGASRRLGARPSAVPRAQPPLAVPVGPSSTTTVPRLASVESRQPCPVNPDETFEACLSGGPGHVPEWTPLPALFRQNGYMVLGSGKYYHDGCRGLGGGTPDLPPGNGAPPMADASLSWTNNSVQFPDIARYRSEFGGFGNTYGQAQGLSYLAPDDEPAGCEDYCVAAGAAPNGSGLGGGTALCDYVTYNDAVAKLRFASDNLKATGQPFLLVTGIRRPHLNWRTPALYSALYPPDKEPLPAQRILDPSVPNASFAVFPMAAPPSQGRPKEDFVKSPLTPGNDDQVRVLRSHYHAAITWADYAAGQVLGELEALGLNESTLVVMHADHGWHLGEYAMWEKRSNWELATRVPLVIRTPWVAQSVGRRVRSFVELVDIYQTVADLAGVPLPSSDSVPFDGTSLRPLLEGPDGATIRPYALSQFPRCKHLGMPAYGSRGLPGGHDNTCLDVE
eukprot:gene9087-1633_t